MRSAPGDPFSDPDLDRLAPVAFTRVRRHQGYRIREVDAFISRAIEAQRSPSPSMRPEDVRAVRFRPVWFSEGYDMAEVDTYLDDLEQQLANRDPASVSADPARPDVTARRSGLVGTWTGRLTRALLLVVVLLWLYAQVVGSH